MDISVEHLTAWSLLHQAAHKDKSKRVNKKGNHGLFLNLFLAALGPHCCTLAFFRPAGAPLYCGVWASLCSGLSWSMGSRVLKH